MNKTEIVTICICVIGLLFFVFTVVKFSRDSERQSIEQYVAKHKCKQIGEIVMTRERNKIIYSCDNGVYAR